MTHVQDAPPAIWCSPQKRLRWYHIALALPFVLIGYYIFFPPDDWTVGRAVEQAIRQGADIRLADILPNLNLKGKRFVISFDDAPAETWLSRESVKSCFTDKAWRRVNKRTDHSSRLRGAGKNDLGTIALYDDFGFYRFYRIHTGAFCESKISTCLNASQVTFYKDAQYDASEKYTPCYKIREAPAK